MFLELRRYQLFPGQKDRCVRFMDEVVIPFQRSKGMVIVGSFVDLDSEDTYFWIRRFESEEERQRLYGAVYDSEHWKTAIAPQLPSMINRDTIQVTRLVPTAGSELR